MKFIETSAKTSFNVSDSFVTMTKEIILQMQDKEKSSNKVQSIFTLILGDKKIDLTKGKAKDITGNSGCCK